MPACIDKLNRFLRLESERGYDNRAVVGGLDKFIPAWQKESLSENIDSILCERVLHFLTDYANQDPDSRSLSIQSILVDLKPYFSTFSSPVRHSRPLQTQSMDDLPGKTEPDKTNHTDSHPKPYKEQPITATLPREPQEIQGINAPLTVLPGIGPKNAQTLQTLGLNTLYDLLYYFPRRYDDYSQLKSMN